MSKRLLVTVSFCLAIATSASAATKIWEGTVNNLWSVAGNWQGGVVPVDGDELRFAGGAPNSAMVNDIAGLDLVSLTFPAPSYTYSATGNPITLSGGMTATCHSCVTWSVPTTLTASQTFSGVWRLGSSTNLNGHTLTVNVSTTALTPEGSLTGSGSVVVATIFDLRGTSSFTGTITVNAGAGMDVEGTITNSTVVVNTSGVLTGDGTIPGTTLNSAYFRIGHGHPTCCSGDDATGGLASGPFSMTGGQFSVDLQGTTPGVSYDQMTVTGTVTLANPTLVVNSGLPAAGQSFVIVSNDGADPIIGTFNGLPEGSVLTGAHGITYQITYAGGDGNDIVLTVQSAPITWTGSVNDLWSVGGNWNTGTAPTDGASIVFPFSSPNEVTQNDISGLDLESVTFTGSNMQFSASGNAITLSDGISMTGSSVYVNWSVPITLTGSQTFQDTGFATWAGNIALNGHTLTLTTYYTKLTGSLTGSGNLVVEGNILLLKGTSSFTGTFTVNGHMNVEGSITGSPVFVNNGGSLTGNGTLPATTLNGALLQIGNDGEAGCCGDPHYTDDLSTGAFSMTGGEFYVDIQGTSPGTTYDQLIVTGTVTLANPALLVDTPGVPPGLPAGQSFIILSNDGTDAVSGTFSGKPEGTVFTADGVTFRISYVGGTGNDIVLYSVVPTTTSLISSDTTTVAFEPVTLTATVGSSSGTPTGVVNFRDGATILASATVDGSGVASATVQLPAGSHSIVADFVGTGIYNNSSSAPVAHTVIKATVAFDVILNSDSLEHGQPLIITIDTDGAAPSEGTPTGTITASGGGDSDDDTLDTDGDAVLTLDSLAPGTHTITVTYPGDDNFEPFTYTAEVHVGPAHEIPSLSTMALLAMVVMLAAAGAWVMKS